MTYIIIIVMLIKFTKMHSLGNDFMIIDAISQNIKLTTKQISDWSNRYTGIGFDQCLLIEPSHNSEVDFNYRIFNSNGNEVGQCANGARCVAWFIMINGLTKNNKICLETNKTVMHLEINSDNTITVNMDVPLWEPKTIPIVATQLSSMYKLLNTDINVHAVNVGNPHAVTVVTNVNNIDIVNIGQKISEDPIFPLQANAGFMEIINTQHINLRVYERDCGPTLSCGSAAVAAVAVGRRFYNLERQVRVSFANGDLIVDWPNLTHKIFLTGSVNLVYKGITCV